MSKKDTFSFKNWFGSKKENSTKKEKKSPSAPCNSTKVTTITTTKFSLGDFNEDMQEGVKKVVDNFVQHTVDYVRRTSLGEPKNITNLKNPKKFFYSMQIGEANSDSILTLNKMDESEELSQKQVLPYEGNENTAHFFYSAPTILSNDNGSYEQHTLKNKKHSEQKLTKHKVKNKAAATSYDQKKYPIKAEDKVIAFAPNKQEEYYEVDTGLQGKWEDD